MITLYGKGYSEEDRKGYSHIVYNNTISAIKILIKYSDELPEELDTRIRPENAGITISHRHHHLFSRDHTHHPMIWRFSDAKAFLAECKPETEIDGALAEKLKKVWNDVGIQNTFENRAKFQLPDSASYFFERIDEISKDDYLPSQQDVLRSRVRTTGIVETEFVIESNRFKM